MMKREPGFYWVKFQGHWKIKQWTKPICGDGFFVESNGDFCASECFMEEIDERQIVREEPSK